MRAIQVAAGIIWRGNRFLAAKRPQGKAGAGFWEFPGGKRESGESMADALCRELNEELSISAAREAIFPWQVQTHAYADRTVELHFMHVTAFEGEPRPGEGQELRWVTPEEARSLAFLPADSGILGQLADPPGHEPGAPPPRSDAGEAPAYGHAPFQEPDWNDLWGRFAANTPDPAYWDSRAESYSKHSRVSRYALNFLEVAQPRPDWTVFDMGCGTGTLALPLAERVRAVTAADFSPMMLKKLEESAKASGLANIATLTLSWYDSWDAVPAKSHDVAVASRSLRVRDFRDAVTKLIRVARQRVYLTVHADNGDNADLVGLALGRRSRSLLDYACCYNILHHMGIRANISMLTDHKRRIYPTREDALTDLAGRYRHRLSEGEMEQVLAYAGDHLTPAEGGWQRDLFVPQRWALIWWDLDKDMIEPNVL